MAKWLQSKKPSRNRTPKDVITLTQSHFCKLVAKEFRVSAEALMKAMQILEKGMVLAIARGYRVQWRGLLTIEIRETPERKRYHALEKRYYVQPVSCRVHISTAKDVNKRVRAMAKDEVERAVREIPLDIPSDNHKRVGVRS